MLGVKEQRLRLKWISASEGALFAAEIKSFTEELTALGKNSLAEKHPEIGKLKNRESVQ